MNRVRPLTQAELNALQKEMEEASQWMRAELQRRRKAEHHNASSPDARRAARDSAVIPVNTNDLR